MNFYDVFQNRIVSHVELKIPSVCDPVVLEIFYYFTIVNDDMGTFYAWLLFGG